MSQPTVGNVLTWNGTEGVYQGLTIPLASTTVLGITKLSVSPVNPLNPIAVGDNDPRLLPYIGVPPIYVTPTLVNKVITFKYKTKAGLVASGGGQAGATVLEWEYNAIDSVPNNLDGCLAPVATGGVVFTVQNNDPVNEMYLYPRSGENFRGMAVDAPFVIAPGNAFQLICYDGEDGTFRFA